MVSKLSSRTSGTSWDISYRGTIYYGPASIYRSAASRATVSLATFTSRLRRFLESESLSDATINEALDLSVKDFRRKYGSRRTLVEIDRKTVDLLDFYSSYQTEATLHYRNFWQRVRALVRKDLLSNNTLKDALTYPAAKWRSFYGGGHCRGFIYSGEEAPEHVGKHFHGISAFLHTLGRYDDRSLIWSRLKAGWSLDDALVVPIALAGQRAGSIYRLRQRKTGAVYVGLTVTSVEQRWLFHVRRALAGSKTKLHIAIREEGPEGFEVDVLETGIKDPARLSEREAYWVSELGALGPNGLNSAKPGGLGSARGKIVTYGEETFRSIEEASEVLSNRLGIARHVIRSRLQNEQPIPQSDKVRRHGKHPDAGSNLYRRWLGMLKRHPHAISQDWMTDYDKYKADVSPVPAGMELMRMQTGQPWGPGNIEWVATRTRVERTHGKTLIVHGQTFPSLKAVARAYDIGVSTLKNRIDHQGMSLAEAVTKPLGITSYKQDGMKRIVINGQEFHSKNQAILYIAQTKDLTKHQAKYRLSTGKY